MTQNLIYADKIPKRDRDAIEEYKRKILFRTKEESESICGYTFMCVCVWVTKLFHSCDHAEYSCKLLTTAKILHPKKKKKHNFST